MTTTKTSAWKLPNSLKRAQLQTIATSIGAPISGTKPQLLSGIQQLVEQTSNLSSNGKSNKIRNVSTRDLRILSIDMGIRNLAFAFLTCQIKASSGKDSQTMFTNPEIQRWRRIELSDVAKAFKPARGHDELDAISTNIGEREPKLDSEVSSDAGFTPVVLDESFEPPILAKNAYTFAKYCAGLHPTHILIERQRFRSGGHAAVLEWSLRVGMLESMLHSTFHTLKKEGILSDITVEPILPIRVNKFWFADQEELLTDAYAKCVLEKDGRKEAKLAKIAIVIEMLKKSGAGGRLLSVHEDAKATVDAFMSRSTCRSGTRKATASLEKLDDVADSLLQGLAWLEWQKNRRKLLTMSSVLGVDPDVSSFFKR